VRLDGQGPFLREAVMGTQTSATKLFRVAKDDFIYSRLFASRGAFGVIVEELDGCYVSGEFPTFVPVLGKVDVEFLKYWFRLPSVIANVDEDCSGSTPLTRNRFKENFFLALEIPLPPLEEQRRVVARIEELAAQIHEARTLRHQAAEEAEALFDSFLTARFDSSGWPLKQLPEVAEVARGKFAHRPQ
jgi:type I restriction enzyme S subunit